MIEPRRRKKAACVVCGDDEPSCSLQLGTNLADEDSQIYQPPFFISGSHALAIFLSRAIVVVVLEWRACSLQKLWTRIISMDHLVGKGSGHVISSDAYMAASAGQYAWIELLFFPTAALHLQPPKTPLCLLLLFGRTCGNSPPDHVLASFSGERTRVDQLAASSMLLHAG
jgi:hypothetical protein